MTRFQSKANKVVGQISIPDLLSIVALGSRPPHRLWLLWPRDVAWGIPLTGCDPGIIGCLEWQTYRSGHRA